MSSSIKDSAKQTADLARMQAEMDKENQRTQDKQNQERADFRRMMEKKDESRRLESSRQESHRAEEREQKKDQQTAAQKRGHESGQQNKGPPRHSHQASKQAQLLHQRLDNRHKESSAQKNEQAMARQDGVQESKDAAEDRKTDLDEQETQRVDQKEDRKTIQSDGDVNESAVDPDQRQGRGQQDKEGRQDDGSQPGLQQGAGAADGSSAKSSMPKTIPAAIVAYLVRAIFVGINEEGLKTMRVELKGAGLDGGVLDIKADGGKIFLHFKDVDENTDRLLQGSKGALMRKLEAKGLALEEMTVERLAAS